MENDLTATATQVATHGTTLPPPPTPSATQPHRGKKNWTLAEDKELCLSWLEITQDPPVGVDQKGGTFWRRVADAFKQRMPTTDRDWNGVKHRWQTIKTAVNMFSGILSQLPAKSGENNDDKQQRAATAYYELEGTKFTFMHCWVQVKDAAKWQNQQSQSQKPKPKKKASSTTTSASSSSGSGLPTASPSAVSSAKDSEDNPFLARPLGRKSAKRMLSENAVLDSLAKSSARAADSAEKMALYAKQKADALVTISDDVVMSKNLQDLDEDARRYYAIKKKKILHRAELEELEFARINAVSALPAPPVPTVVEDADDADDAADNQV